MIETPVVSPVEPIAPADPPPAPPAVVWWVNAKGTPSIRHLAHQTKPGKTACNFSIKRYREATPDEVQRLGVCAFCQPAGKALLKKAKRGRR